MNLQRLLINSKTRQLNTLRYIFKMYITVKIMKLKMFRAGIVEISFPLTDNI